MKLRILAWKSAELAICLSSRLCVTIAAILVPLLSVLLQYGRGYAFPDIWAHSCGTTCTQRLITNEMQVANKRRAQLEDELSTFQQANNQLEGRLKVDCEIVIFYKH